MKNWVLIAGVAVLSALVTATVTYHLPIANTTNYADTTVAVQTTLPVPVETQPQPLQKSETQDVVIENDLPDQQEIENNRYAAQKEALKQQEALREQEILKQQQEQQQLQQEQQEQQQLIFQEQEIRQSQIQKAVNKCNEKHVKSLEKQNKLLAPISDGNDTIVSNFIEDIAASEKQLGQIEFKQCLLNAQSIQ